MNVIKPSIPMRSEPNETSELETECLFGESWKTEIFKELTLPMLTTPLC